MTPAVAAKVEAGMTPQVAVAKVEAGMTPQVAVAKVEAGMTPQVAVAKLEAGYIQTQVAASEEDSGCPVVGSALAGCSLGRWQWQARWRAEEGRREPTSPWPCQS
jgi:hypothetical protein